jgi:hypothetical protein
MASFDNVYEDFTGYLADEKVEYQAEKVADALGDLSDDELAELDELLDDPELTYEDFCDWCEEHDIRYH